MARRAPRPRDAASLVIYRRRGGAVELLMGHRHPDHVFMPNVLVFPGGGVDDADNHVVPAAPLADDVLARLMRAATARRARALAVAAVRETFEETGLLLADDAADRWHRAIGPRLDMLDYVYRAVTPPVNPRRFNTRFFLAPAEAMRGRLAGTGELVDLGWRALDAARAATTAHVTRRVIAEVERLLASPPGPRDRPVPISQHRYGRRVISSE